MKQYQNAIFIASAFMLTLLAGCQHEAQTPARVVVTPPKIVPKTTHNSPPKVKPKLRELTERQRHDIWNDYVSQEAKLDKKVDGRFPSKSLNSLDRMQKTVNYEQGLRDKYMPGLLKRWHITEHEQSQIEVEGIQKQWAAPEPIGPHPERFPE